MTINSLYPNIKSDISSIKINFLKKENINKDQISSLVTRLTTSQINKINNNKVKMSKTEMMDNEYLFELEYTPMVTEEEYNYFDQRRKYKSINQYKNSNSKNITKNKDLSKVNDYEINYIKISETNDKSISNSSYIDNSIDRYLKTEENEINSSFFMINKKEKSILIKNYLKKMKNKKEREENLKIRLEHKNRNIIIKGNQQNHENFNKRCDFFEEKMFFSKKKEKEYEQIRKNLHTYEMISNVYINNKTKYDNCKYIL